MNIKFKHHHLNNGNILTVCSAISTMIDESLTLVHLGYAMFNANDKEWNRKKGNKLARSRLLNSGIYFTMDPCDPISHNYLCYRALITLLLAAKEGGVFLPKKSLAMIAEEAASYLLYRIEW